MGLSVSKNVSTPVVAGTHQLLSDSVSSQSCTGADSSLSPSSIQNRSLHTASVSLPSTASSQFKENLEALHHQLMQQAGADLDIGTATTLTYSQFLAYITQLNNICRLYQDEEGRVLLFAVKKGTDSSIFWKATVRIACIKFNLRSNNTESYRLLTIRQFLQVFRRITYECTDGGLGAPPPHLVAGGETSRRHPPPSTAATLVLEELSPHTEEETAAKGECEELEECVICLERRPEVILPCTHAYCLPCIQQWWEYSLSDWSCAGSEADALPQGDTERTCPVCRKAVTDTDDTWVISEAPDDALVTQEISQALMGLASSSCQGASGSCGFSC